ncbi:hypothetical protein JHK84_051583 [Glycine max]|nr:hypothetical protein JHK84_051583 [Glycine max]
MGLPNVSEDLSSEVEVDAFKRIFPLRYFERHLAESIRADGRPLGKARETSAVAFANGSALVKIGSTTMLTAIKMEIMTPSLESPDEGCLDWLLLVGPLISRMIDLKELSLVSGKAAWMAYLNAAFFIMQDIYCLDADGALFDAALLSAIAALSHCCNPSPYSQSPEWLEMILSLAKMSRQINQFEKRRDSREGCHLCR